MTQPLFSTLPQVSHEPAQYDAPEHDIAVWWEYGRMDVAAVPFLVRHRLTLCGGITVRDHGDCWGARDSARIAREYGIQWPEVQ